MNETSNEGEIRIVLTAEQIQKRVRELGRQISDDFRGHTIHLVCVLNNSFMFMADLVRALDAEVVCYFVRSDIRELAKGASGATEVFFSPEPDVRRAHVLLLETLVHSGVTSEFLMRNLQGRGAASVRLAALLGRPAARRVQLQADYFGFLIDEPYVFGYGLGAPETRRNLPYLAAAGPARTNVAAR